ncbi:MAG: acetyl-CoA carboxylase biotin carboxyl carrier protein [Alphaproteobacteria bacterium]|nr:acetyl-CoA carboxylase biotin carboxyl carrier protein [Alphaproteobacteria bacterium]
MSDTIDTKIVSRLAAILKVNDLAELEYETESVRISLIKSRGVVTAPAVAPVVAPAPVVTPAAPVNTPTENKESNVDVASLPGCVKSPMVGVVYLASDPNAAPYVKIGDTVSQGDTVCLIEAMKTFNPVKASMGGKVTKILVESGDPVEYGEPLVVIE